MLYSVILHRTVLNCIALYCTALLWASVSLERICIRILDGRSVSGSVLGVAGQADLGVTVSSTLGAGVVWRGSGFEPPFSVSLFRSVGQVSPCPGRCPAAQHASKCWALCSYGFPGVGVDARCLRVPLAFVFVAQMRSVSVILSLHKLSVQEILGDLAIVHSDCMSEPAQAFCCLTEICLRHSFEEL